MSFLNIENLYASYGNIQALKGISLTVNQGGNCCHRGCQRGGEDDASHMHFRSASP